MSRGALASARADGNGDERSRSPTVLVQEAGDAADLGDGRRSVDRECGLQLFSLLGSRRTTFGG